MGAKAKEAYGAITGDEERRAEAQESRRRRRRGPQARAQEEAREAGAQEQGTPGRRHGHLVRAIDALSRRQS